MLKLFTMKHLPLKLYPWGTILEKRYPFPVEGVTWHILDLPLKGTVLALRAPFLCLLFFRVAFSNAQHKYFLVPRDVSKVNYPTSVCVMFSPC